MSGALALAAATGLPEISHRESDDGYASVVAVLNARWRVIECKDRIQWILQFAKSRRDTRVWEGRSFVRSREGLFRVVSHHAGPVSPDALAILQFLPARFPEGPRP